MSDEIRIVEVNPVYRATEAETRVEVIPDDKKDEFVNLIKTIAAGIFSGGNLPPGMEFDDLVSYGWEGLVKAWKNFNNDKGAIFRTYATYRIRGEILDNIRKEWKTKNPGYSKRVDKEKVKERIMELARDMAEDPEENSDPDNSLYQALNSSAIIYLLSLENIENISTVLQRQDVGDEIIGRIERSNERINLHDSIQKLTIEEQQLLKLYYYENKNQMEIAKVMQMSKSKVSRLHMKVLDKLKRNVSYKMGRKWSI
jgi:RNA polymerase sigma factor for flagellar operon FliA